MTLGIQGLLFTFITKKNRRFSKKSIIFIKIFFESMDYKDWKNGDIIRVKSNRLVDHYAVFFFNENQEPTFAHNCPSRDISIDCADVFWIERKFISCNRSLISGIDLESLTNRLTVLKGKKYNLFAYDCEDFVSELTGNMLKRKQTLKYLAVASILLGIGLTIGGYKLNNYYKNG